MGQVLLLVEVSRSHSDTRQSVVVPWTSDRPVAKTSTRLHTTADKETMSMSSAGLESATPASERPQTHALDRAAQNYNKTNK